MRRRIIACLILILTLSGCTTERVEGSLRVPEMPAEFIEFNDELSKIKAQGLELVTPQGGTNRQSVQLADLDGDGVDEGIAFFREMANSYKCYAYVLKKNDDGYEIMTKIEGAGDTVDNVAYADMLGNGNNDLIIGWSVSDSDARSVTVHTVMENDIKKLCEIAGLYYLTYDINGDVISDLCVVSEDEAGMQTLSVYMAEEGSLVLKSTAPLSQNSEKIMRLRSGYVKDTLPAIFVEKEYVSSGLVTDVIVWQDESLRNITYSEEEKMSSPTARRISSYCEDIDGDMALEIPLPQLEEMPSAPVDSELLEGIVWHGFDERDRMIEKAYTFRQASENWYISLPLDWISRTIAARHIDDFSYNTTTFYSLSEGKETEALFTIAVISGENREKYMEQLGYEKVSERNNVIYAVNIHKKRYLGYDITTEMITERFYYSSGEWSTGEVVF